MVPRSGSAYAYIYVTIGEFAAFIIGWDLVLEYMIGKKFDRNCCQRLTAIELFSLFSGAAGTANALSQYINSLCGNQIQEALRSAMPMNLTGLGPYPDFFAFSIIVVVVGMSN